MSERNGPRPSGIRVRRLALCSAVALVTTAASWVNPPPLSPAPASPLPAAPARHPARVPSRRPARPAAGQPDGGFAQSALRVAQWGFRGGDGEDIAATDDVPAGRPLTLWMTLDGNQAALDRMRARGAIAIEVRWQRQADSAVPGAPDLVTRLAIGHPGLADRLAGEVRRTGFFEWHSWAEKTSLSPGVWTVSLTYPDGTPLLCGDPPAPCRFSLRVG